MFFVLLVAAYVPTGTLPVQMGRVRFVLAFVIATLAARGYDLMEKRVVAPTVAAAAVVLAAAALFWPRAVELQLAPIVGATVAMVVISAVILAMGAKRLLTVALFADLAVLTILSVPPHGRAEFYSETGAIGFLRAQRGGFRIAGVGGSLFPNTGAMFGLDDIRMHDPMAPEAYMRLLARGGLDRRGYFEVFHSFPARPLANALSVRYIVAPAGSSSPLPAVYRGPDAVVFLNAGARDLATAPPARPPGWMAGWVLGIAGVALLAQLAVSE
jgi:hypothetical protein